MTFIRHLASNLSTKICLFCHSKTKNLLYFTSHVSPIYVKCLFIKFVTIYSIHLVINSETKLQRRFCVFIQQIPNNPIKSYLLLDIRKFYLIKQHQMLCKVKNITGSQILHEKLKTSMKFVFFNEFHYMFIQSYFIFQLSRIFINVVDT